MTSSSNLTELRQGTNGYEEQTFEVTLDDAPKDLKASRKQKKQDKDEEIPENQDDQDDQNDLNDQDDQEKPSIQFDGGEDDHDAF